MVPPGVRKGWKAQGSLGVCEITMIPSKSMKCARIIGFNGTGDNFRALGMQPFAATPAPPRLHLAQENTRRHYFSYDSEISRNVPRSLVLMLLWTTSGRSECGFFRNPGSPGWVKTQGITWCLRDFYDSMEIAGISPKSPNPLGFHPSGTARIPPNPRKVVVNMPPRGTTGSNLEQEFFEGA